MMDQVQRDETRWSPVIDEALQLLQDEGFYARGAEAQDLLTSRGAGRSAEGRLQVRTARSREVLTRLPEAFNLYDRAGDKIATLAGGRRISGNGVLFATAPTPWTRVRRPAGELRDVSSRDLWQVTRECAQLPNIAVQGTTPLPARPQPPLAELLRLHVGLCVGTHPHLVRVRHGDAVESIWNLLRALRGDAQAVQRRPTVILELLLEKPRELSAPAGRILIDSARYGLPLAIRLPAIAPLGATPADERSRTPGESTPAPKQPLVEMAATALAAILVHQTARAQSPLLWGIPPISAAATVAARHAAETLLRMGDFLALPTVATASSSEETGTLLSAAWAASRGARMILVGTGAATSEGALEPDRLRAIAARLPEVAAIAAHPPVGIPALGHRPIAESHHRKLADALAAEAERRGGGELPLTPPV